jgi:hypothetical protein
MHGPDPNDSGEAKKIAKIKRHPALAGAGKR